MATQNIINIGDSARCFTGVATWGGAGGYFDDTTLGSFTVSRPGTGFIKGKPVAWAGAQTVTGMTAGNTYYICIDSAGLIYKTTDEAVAYGGDYIPLFECLRDSTSPTNNQITVREDHPYNMPYLVNHYLHDSIGPIIENHDKGANITLKGTQQLTIAGADKLLDHGLTTDIADTGTTAITVKKMYTNAPGSGSKWCLYSSTDTFTGNYNNGGTVTALGGSKFGVYTIYVSKDNLTSSSPTYYAVLDTSQYNNQAAAQTAIGNGSTAYATAELAALELCKLGYIIYASGTPGNIAQVIIAKSTFQSSVTTTGTNAASLISTTTTNFNGLLSSTDTNVQAALDTLDNWGQSTDGQLIIGKTSNPSVKATLTASTGITVANGAGTITLSSTTTTGNTQTDSYTLVIGDAGKLIIMNKGTANTLTVPKNSSVAFATGTVIAFMQYGAGTTTIAPVDGDVTLRSAGSLLSAYTQYSTGVLIKIGTDEWVVSGDLS